MVPNLGVKNLIFCQNRGLYFRKSDKIYEKNSKENHLYQQTEPTPVVIYFGTFVKCTQRPHLRPLYVAEVGQAVLVRQPCPYSVRTTAPGIFRIR